jgi:small subunit ribosomal protein S6
MRPYEVVYILRPDMEEEPTTQYIDRISGIITTMGGTVDNIDKWGKRRLAYEINDQREGYYVVVKFHGGPKVAGELDRIFKISDEVLRHIIILEE